MKINHVSRRSFLTTGSAAIALSVTTQSTTIAANVEGKKAGGFSYCFNTSTIQGQRLSLDKEIKIIAQAGYDAIEPWVNEINQYANSSSDLNNLRKLIMDSGLTVESAIAFSNWIVDDDAQRTKGLEQAKRDMDVLARIGGKRIAAPPVGATGGVDLDLLKVAERYRVLLELGDEMGVIPQVEVWGHSRNLHSLGQSMFVVIESGHPKACLLPDVYHIYKGGSDFNGLKQLSAHAIQVFHMNDYPADPPREKIGDRDRVYPGDGIAPLTQILQDLLANNSNAVLSLELFNPAYWKLDPLEVARNSLAKMKNIVNKTLEQS